MGMGLAPVIGLSGGIGAALGSRGGGKGGGKGSDAANQQLQMQREQMQYGHNLTDTGMSAWTPAANYYKSLLGGDRGAVAQAIGPTSQMIRQGGTAQLSQLANSMPAGGERNLALAQSRMGTYNQLGNLYAGVQPGAASELGRLAQIPIGAGVGVMGQAAPNVGAAMYQQTAQQGNKMQGAAGLGNLIYRMGTKGRAGGAGAGGGA